MKLEFGEKEKADLREAVQLFRDAAEAIGKCGISEEYYTKPFTEAADLMEEILDNNGLLD